MQVSATKDGRAVTVEYDFGDSLQQAVEKFGEDVVWKAALQQLKIRLQAVIREQIAAGKSDEEIAQHVAGWKPGQAPQRKSAVEKLAEKLAGLSKEEQQRVLAEFRQLIAQGQGQA